MQKIIRLGLFISVLLCGICHAQSDRIIAVINNEIVSKQDLDTYISFLKMQLQQQHQAISDVEINDIKVNALNNLIDQKLILDEAKREESKLEEEQFQELSRIYASVIKKRVEKFKEQFPNEDEFNDYLAKNGLNKSDMESQIKEQLMINRCLDQHVYSKIKVSPQEITDYYLNAPEEFAKKEQKHIKAITFAKEEELQQVQDRLTKTTGLKEILKIFNESEDKIDLGLISADSLDQDVQEVVQTLKKEEYSKTLRKNGMFYIFLVADIVERQEVSLLEAQKRIYDTVYQRKSNELLSQWLEKLKKKAHIVVKEDCYE